MSNPAPPIGPVGRARLYWASESVSLLAGVATVFAGALDVTPRWLTITIGVLLLVQSRVSNLAKANVDANNDDVRTLGRDLGLRIRANRQRRDEGD